MFYLSKNEITYEVIEAFCREWQEGVRVEYKQEFTNAVPKIVSSFANTQGGIFIIGVDADKTHNKVKFPITGIPITDGIEERIVQSAITGIYPPVMPEVIITDVPETKNVIVVVRVMESNQAPHAIQNSTIVYIRFESITQHYTRLKLAELNAISSFGFANSSSSTIYLTNLSEYITLFILTNLSKYIILSKLTQFLFKVSLIKDLANQRYKCHMEVNLFIR